mmetsp:Transcript_61600/g.133338  ORF Transcript_61600/g.133338 Transcript_61600/m.133338 type:complete len:104 (+) Transcript_61600:899-1210(+)
MAPPAAPAAEAPLAPLAPRRVRLLAAKRASAKQFLAADCERPQALRLKKVAYAGCSGRVEVKAQSGNNIQPPCGRYPRAAAAFPRQTPSRLDPAAAATRQGCR